MYIIILIIIITVPEHCNDSYVYFFWPIKVHELQSPISLESMCANTIHDIHDICHLTQLKGTKALMTIGACCNKLYISYMFMYSMFVRKGICKCCDRHSKCS